MGQVSVKLFGVGGLLSFEVRYAGLEGREFIYLLFEGFLEFVNNLTLGIYLRSKIYDFNLTLFYFLLQTPIKQLSLLYLWVIYNWHSPLNPPIITHQSHLFLEIRCYFLIFLF